MFVEADGLVVIAVKQSFTMKARFVDQARKMDIPSQPLVGTARKQLLHQLYLTRRRQTDRMWRRKTMPFLARARPFRFQIRKQFRLLITPLSNNELAGK